MTMITAASLPYQLPFFAATTAAVVAFLLFWRRRTAPGSAWVLLLLGGLAAWALSYALELGSRDLGTREDLTKLEYFGIAAAPVGFFGLALGCTRKRALLRSPFVALLLTAPFVTWIVVVLDDPFGWIWSSRKLVIDGPIAHVDATYAPGFWVHYVASNALIVAGVVILVKVALSSQKLFRGQTAVLLAGFAVPWALNALYVFRVPPFDRVDWTSAGFTVSGTTAAWAFRHFRLLDIVPVARDRVLAAMDDGVVVLDEENRIADLNPAAERLLGRALAEAGGASALEFFPAALAERLRSRQGTADDRFEVDWPDGRVLEVRLTPLPNTAGDVRGTVLIWHDWTERRRVETRLEYLSSHDALTGLRNRASFEEQLRLLAAHPARFPVSFIVADLDDLKVVNDRHGHEAGDDLLRLAARLFADNFREEDIVARFGGDEFVAILERTEEVRAREILDRTRARVTSIPEREGHGLLRLSLGCATASAIAAIGDALRRADLEMYRDKAPAGPASAG